jgi:hypothetical protein
VQTAHGVTRPLDRPTTEYPTYATIPGPLHQISYSCHGPRLYTSCRTYHLHTTRQANTILHMKQRKTKQKYPRFEFKPRQVNDSSQLNQETDHLVSQSPSRTPPLTPGFVAARPHLSATPHRIARAPPPSPIRQPASTASACCRLRPRRPEPFQCRGPAADPTVHRPFSLHRVACPSRPLPHFPSLLLPVCPPIWRRRRCLTSLGSASTSELELPSFSTAYAPASPAPTTGDPSSSLVPARAPPSSAIIGEHNCALSLHPNGLTPHLLPPSLTL